ncbi:hypothetical protein FACS189419_03190 [Planctomycetales bacterium]|nr:hypothetical protein FACS189419_03190 [Planctomycetales bacterium]
MKMTRRALYLFDRLASKLVKPSEQPAMVAFIPTNNGVYIASVGDNAAVSLFVLSKERITPFVVPLTLVKELAVSKSNDDVNFDVTGNTVTVHWYQDAIPNHRRHTFSAVPKLPPMPSKTTSHSKLLLDAITDASKVTDKDNARYALGSVSLNGETGQIAATDGRQCLVQDGFKFAFQENALLPVSKIFTSKEFREAGENITLGFEKGLIYFSVGTVHLWYKSIYRRQKEGKDTNISELPGLITGIWKEMLEVEQCFFDDDEHETKCRYQVVDLITAYLHDVDVRCEKVIAIERKFESIIQTYDTNEIFHLPLVGVIDLIIEKPEGLVIIDFKTAASASYCSLQHEIQLAAYAYLVREFFGQNEAKLEIRQLIKTKTPKIITQSYPPRNDWQMKRFFSLVREYHEALETGTFNYRPSWNCSMCEHIEICQS